MKKFVFSAFVLAFFSFLSGNAQAASIEKFYTVNSYGSYAEQNTFQTGETPYLYMKLSDPGLNFKSVFWNTPFGESYMTADDRNNLTPVTETWFSLYGWADISKIGKWSLRGNYYYEGSPLRVNAASYNFSVTPEPASIVLFLTGGLALAAAFFRRKNSSLIPAGI